MDRREVVVFNLAKFEEAGDESVRTCSTGGYRNGGDSLFTQLWCMINEQVDDNIASACLEKDRHDCG